MFRIFGKPKQEASTVATFDKLPEPLELLEKKEHVHTKKAAEEVEKAKAFTRAKNKRGFVNAFKDFSVFSWLCGKPKLETSIVPILDKLSEVLEWLEKREQVFTKKAAEEIEKAMAFNKAKNKRAAVRCLKRRKLYVQQIDQLGNFQLRIHDQVMMLEGAIAATETVDALRTGVAVMKALPEAMNIDDVDKTMDEINEQTENMKQIQEALSTPIGAAAVFDEDMLEAELEGLEGAELEEGLGHPLTQPPLSTTQVPGVKQPARHQKQTAEDDEIAALQAEMAL